MNDATLNLNRKDSGSTPSGISLVYLNVLHIYPKNKHVSLYLFASILESYVLLENMTFLSVSTNYNLNHQEALENMHTLYTDSYLST